MHISDRIYGHVQIKEQVLLDLITTPSFQRLKRIEQLGLPDQYYHVKGFKRYEHCIGVMILLRRLGASLEEQVAGLLHDVSHTAFSHLIDWVIGDEAVEDFQDNNHEAFILRTELADVLRRHGVSPQRVADYHPFTLLEREAPDLCADRVDYALREMPKADVLVCAPNLVNVDSQIVFNDLGPARCFAQRYLDLQMYHWGAYEAVSRYRLAANALKHALKNGVITPDDFWSDGQSIIETLLATNDPLYEKTFSLLARTSLEGLPKDSKPAHKKFRHVDPPVLHEGVLTRVSTLDSSFADRLVTARKENEEGVYPIDVEVALTRI